jgi:hypothetical protein
MKTILKIAAATVLMVTVGSMSAFASCNGDASTETVLGAGSGALVGGLASHSIVGAAIGGMAGGVIGNAIGHSNNREDCRRDAYYGSDNYAYQGNPTYYPDANRDQGYYTDTNRASGYYPDANRDYRVDRQEYRDQNGSEYNQ